jgi:hypothetical protein
LWPPGFLRQDGSAAAFRPCGRRDAAPSALIGSTTSGNPDALDAELDNPRAPTSWWWWATTPFPARWPVRRWSAWTGLPLQVRLAGGNGERKVAAAAAGLSATGI